MFSDLQNITVPPGSFVYFKSRPDVESWVVQKSSSGCHLIRRLLDTSGSHETVKANGTNLSVLVSSDQDILKPEGYIMQKSAQPNEIALQFAKSKHQGQIRKFSGLPYVTHCINVSEMISCICKSKCDNAEVLTKAALLHDTLEDTNTTYDELKENFGLPVADLVLSLTNDKEEIQKMGKTAYMVSKVQQMDADTLLIKLADRLDNIRDISHKENRKAWSEQYAKQTKEILESILLSRKLPLTANHMQLIETIKLVLDVFFEE
jgi:hypothetical protein